MWEYRLKPNEFLHLIEADFFAGHCSVKCSNHIQLYDKENENTHGINVNWAQSERTFSRLNAQSLGEWMRESWWGPRRHFCLVFTLVIEVEDDKTQRDWVQRNVQIKTPVQQVFGGERRTVAVSPCSAPLCRRHELVLEERAGRNQGAGTAPLRHRGTVRVRKRTQTFGNSR